MGEGSADFCLLGKLRGRGEATMRGAPSFGGLKTSRRRRWSGCEVSPSKRWGSGVW